MSRLQRDLDASTSLQLERMSYDYAKRCHDGGPISEQEWDEWYAIDSRIYRDIMDDFELYYSESFAVHEPDASWRAQHQADLARRLEQLLERDKMACAVPEVQMVEESEVKLTGGSESKHNLPEHVHPARDDHSDRHDHPVTHNHPITHYHPVTHNHPVKHNHPARHDHPTRHNYPVKQNYPTRHNYPVKQNYPTRHNYPAKHDYPTDHDHPARRIMHLYPGKQECFSLPEIDRKLYGHRDYNPIPEQEFLDLLRQRDGIYASALPSPTNSVWAHLDRISGGVGVRPAPSGNLWRKMREKVSRRFESREILDYDREIRDLD